MARSKNPVLRWLFLVCGWIALVVGVVALFVPLLPTTPFLLLAAACFDRGSERFHVWLINHKWFGPPIRSWREHGVINPRAKALAIAMMTGSLVLIIVIDWLAGWLKLVLVAILMSCMAFVGSRPSRPKGSFSAPPRLDS